MDSELLHKVVKQKFGEDLQKATELVIQEAALIWSIPFKKENSPLNRDTVKWLNDITT